VNRFLFWGYKSTPRLFSEPQSPTGSITTEDSGAERLPRLRVASLLMPLMLVAFMSTIPGCNKQDDAEKPREQPAQVSHKPPKGQTYRRPLGNDPASIDPARITDFYAVAVANQIFDSLVEFDAHLNILPSLAQSWSASRNGLVWTFNLRQGVKFHNGREFIADDVVYSLSRFLHPAVRSRRSWFLENVKGADAFQDGTAKELEGIRAMDRYTVQITLSEPFAPFISILGLPHLAMVPREEVERLGADFSTSPVGTGAFRFVRWERGREIILEANDHYFRGRPALDRIRFVIFPGNVVSDMLAAFERGELEESFIPPEQRKELLESGKYTVVRKPTLGLRFYAFNLELPPFNQREVRQAFNYTIDTTRINQEVLEKRHTVARGILPPGMPGYNPEAQGYRYDPEKAKELLAQGGYPGGKGSPVVTLASSVKSTISRQDYEAVRQFMASVGVHVESREFESWPTFQQAMQLGELQMFRYAWYADYPDPDNFLYFLFHSQSKDNPFHYRNPMVDRLLDDARRETDDLSRVKLYRKAEQLILDDAPGVMLMYHTYEGLFQPYVTGIEVSALGDPYTEMWKIRMKPVGQVKRQ
jgi:oligopeptide transport system substrate-binding protein